MPVTQPKNLTSSDGTITVIGGGSPGNYEYRYRRIAPSLTAWSLWSSGDGPGNLSKTYTGLSVGTYQVEVDKDNLLGDPHTCVSLIEVVLTAKCEDECGAGGGNGGDDGCGNVLEVIEKTGLTPTNLPEHVRFEKIDAYNIGESELTFEAWVKAPIENANLVLFNWESQEYYGLGSPSPGTMPTGTYFRYTIQVIGTNQNCGGIVAGTQGTGSGGGAASLGNPYGGQNGAAIKVTYGYKTGSDTYTNSTSGFTAQTAPVVWDVDNFNHVVVISKAVPYNTNPGSSGATATLPDIIEDTAPPSQYEPVFFNCFEIYINGIKVDTVWDALMGDSNPKSRLSLAERDVVANYNNYEGPLLLFARQFGFESGGGVPCVTAPTSGEVTNFRLYSRAISKKEVQKNFLAGCHGDPYECAQLMLHAPLDQTNGFITIEKINGNHGILTGFDVARTNRQSIGTENAAWTNECCPPNEFNESACPSNQCNPDFVEFSFTINGAPAGPESALVLAFTQGLDACPTPSAVVGASILETLGTIYLLGTGGVGSIASKESVADAFVLAFNNVFNPTSDNQIYARANLNTVTIRMTSKLYTAYCNRMFSACLYGGTAVTPASYTGGYSITYPNNNQISICCLPADACDTTEAPTFTI